MRAQDTKVIRGGCVLDPCDDRPRRVDIVIAGDTIVEIGAPGMPAPPAALIVAAQDRLLIPGLVNAHTHSHYTLAKGIAGAWNLEMLIHAGPWAAGSRTLEDLHLGSMLGAVEMVRKGCTACCDMVLQLPLPTPEGMANVARGYLDVGMRAVVAPALADRTFWESIPGLLDALPASMRRSVEDLAAKPFDASFERCKDIFANWPFDRDQVRPAIAPTIPLLCSDAFLVAASRMSREFGVGFHTHLAESKAQAISAKRRYGQSLTAHLARLGVLGEGCVAAHAIWLDANDMRRLAASGTSVAHNPGSNMRLGNGIAPVRAMLDAGINVGIGTDASVCSDQLNMFESMRLATLASRVETPDYERWLGPAQALRMATANGAKALGFDRIGELRPGYKADIVFLDLTDINYLPLNVATNQVVYCENGAAVESVMIGGRLVLDHRVITTIDHAQLVARVREAAERLALANAPRRAETEPLASIVGRFCVGLAREPHHVHRYIEAAVN
jgi:5-methylthioadenosine/S-adenosylhomocysteine deaminase